MSYLSRVSNLALALLLLVVAATADNKGSSAKPQPLTKETRLNIIRSMDAELAYVRKPFPMGEKGLTLTTDGKITPGDEEMGRLLATYGPAAHPGDRVRITDVIIKGNAIRFEINGGPKKKKKWYEHLQVGMGGTMASPTAPGGGVNPRGSFVTLVFPENFVPETTVEQLKKWLSPVLDFSSLSATQAYLDTIPPKAKEAIKNHQVLVGMNREMVAIALGRPPKKYRDKDEKGRDYEEWIYGEPPNPVQFVRFEGDEVVRLEIMQVGGQKVVKTEKEIDLQQASAKKPEEQQPSQSSKPMKRPTLRRPGEQPETPGGASPGPSSGPAGIDPNQQDPTLGPPMQRGPQSQPMPPPPSTQPSPPQPPQ